MAANPSRIEFRVGLTTAIKLIRQAIHSGHDRYWIISGQIEGASGLLIQSDCEPLVALGL